MRLFPGVRHPAPLIAGRETVLLTILLVLIDVMGCCAFNEMIAVAEYSSMLQTDKRNRVVTFFIG